MAGEECEQCRRMQGRATSGSARNEIPPIVHAVLSSTAKPLDPATRGLMEARFAGLGTIGSNPPTIQTKLAINSPSGADEREADHIAAAATAGQSSSTAQPADFSHVRLHDDGR